MKMAILAAALVPGWMVFAQNAAAATDGGFTGLLTGSAVTVLAAIVIAFIRRWIVPGASYDRDISRLESQVDALRTELEARNREDREHLIPTIVSAITEALRQTRQEGGNTT